MKNLILKMAVNGSGIRDTARVLGISTSTVIKTLKDANDRIDNVNPIFLKNNTISLKKTAKFHLIPFFKNKLQIKNNIKA